MRYDCVLPADYRQRLETMTLAEIAAEAACYRSSGVRPGTCTKLIIRWVRINSADEFNAFLAIYREFWAAEKAARAADERSRPSRRPVVGSRVRTQRARRSIAHQPVLA